MKIKVEIRWSPLILTIIFVILRLADMIEWPWLWVLSPIWISLAVIVVAVPLLVFYIKKRGR